MGVNIIQRDLSDYELKQRYGWLASIVAAVILSIGRVVYVLFRGLYGFIHSLASRV